MNQRSCIGCGSLTAIPDEPDPLATYECADCGPCDAPVDVFPLPTIRDRMERVSLPLPETARGDIARHAFNVRVERMTRAGVGPDGFGTGLLEHGTRLIQLMTTGPGLWVDDDGALWGDLDATLLDAPDYAARAQLVTSASAAVNLSPAAAGAP